MIVAASERHRCRQGEGAPHVVRVDFDAVGAGLLIFVVAATGDVARFELEFEIVLEQLEALARDEIDAQARVLDDIGLAGVEQTAAEDALAGVAEQDGLLR